MLQHESKIGTVFACYAGCSDSNNYTINFCGRFNDIQDGCRASDHVQNISGVYSTSGIGLLLMINNKIFRDFEYYAAVV